MSVNIAYGLDQSSVTLTKFVIEQTYTGKIGLDYRVFATSADGATTLSTAVEYRTVPLTLDGVTTLEIGQNPGAGSPAGSGRINLALGTTASAITVFNTASAPTDSSRNAVRITATNAANTLDVRSAPGGVGIALDKPNETSQFATITVADDSTASRVNLGSGVTLATWKQLGGTNNINSAGTITTVNVYGGVVTIEGIYTITTLNLYAGTVNDNHTSGGNAVTTANLKGGTLNLNDSRVARTYATTNWYKNTTLDAGSHITLTAITVGTDGDDFTLTIT